MSANSTTAPAMEEAKYLMLREGERERDRLDKQHKLVQGIVGPLLPAGLNLAKGDHVLDSATGTGAWALQLSTQCKHEIFVTGTDINPRFFPPTPPENVTFTVHSALVLPPAWTEWFRVIHQRFLSGGLSLADWGVVLKEMHRVLKPNGWVQLEEFSATLWPADLPEDALPYSKQILAGAAEFSKYRDIALNAGESIPEMLKAAGFTNITDRKLILQLGPGEKTVDMRNNFIRLWGHIRDGMEGTAFSTTDEEYATLMENVKKEMEENEVGWDLHVITARKPDTSGASK